MVTHIINDKTSLAEKQEEPNSSTQEKSLWTSPTVMRKRESSLPGINPNLASELNVCCLHRYILIKELLSSIMGLVEVAVDDK